MCGLCIYVYVLYCIFISFFCQLSFQIVSEFAFYSLLHFSIFTFSVNLFLLLLVHFDF